MYFEVIRGRGCDSLVKAQIIEISAIESAVMAQSKIVIQQKAEISAQAYALWLQIQQLASERDMARLKNEGLKTRLMKSRKWVIGEGGVIVVLILVLIL
jgi:hypothetical protein